MGTSRAARAGVLGSLLLALLSSCDGTVDGLEPASPRDEKAETTPVDLPPPVAAPEQPKPAPEAPAYALHPLDIEVAEHPLDDRDGQALAHLYEALARIDRPETPPEEALVRVTHWGDSSIGRDGFPDALRFHFWERFGDGGPGFIMPEAFTGFYQPKSVLLEGNEKWSHCYIAYRCRPDGNYGFGGVIFSSSGGAKAHFETISGRRKRKWGRSWDHAELWYAAFPRGGQLSIQVDGGEPVRLDTNNPQWEDRWWSTDFEAGSHGIDLRARGFGRSRVYGLVLEAPGPGVVWDAIPMSGAFTKRLRNWGDEHIREQVAHRRPDLIVFQYGGNDLKRIVTGTDPSEFREELDEVLPKLLEGHQRASCLVIGISAHGRSGHFEVDYEDVEKIVNVQRDAALAHGCAFFDSLAAMGGESGLKDWRRQHLIWGDLAHLSPRGHERMAQMLWSAIISDYVAFRRRPEPSP
jgi:lysophospholipase L1-like esterase